MTSTFLSNMTPQWKEKYVKGFISIAGAYGGATKVRYVIIAQCYHTVYTIIVAAKITATKYSPRTL